MILVIAGHIFFPQAMLLPGVFTALCPLFPFLVVLINVPPGISPPLASPRNYQLVTNFTITPPRVLYALQREQCILSLSALGSDEHLPSLFQPLGSDEHLPLVRVQSRTREFTTWTLAYQCTPGSAWQLAIHAWPHCSEVEHMCIEYQGLCPTQHPPLKDAPSSLRDILVAIVLPAVVLFGCIWVWVRRYDQLNTYCLEPAEELSVACGAYTLWWCCRCCIRSATGRQRHMAIRRLVDHLTDLFPESRHELLLRHAPNPRLHIGFTHARNQLEFIANQEDDELVAIADKELASIMKLAMHQTDQTYTPVDL